MRISKSSRWAAKCDVLISAAVSPLLQPFPMEPKRGAQIWRYQPQYRRPRHFHAEPELNVFLRGRATLGIGDQRVSLSAGSLLWLPPGVDHALLEASSDLEFFVVGLQPGLLEAFANRHGEPLSFATRAHAIDPSVATAVSELCCAMAEGLDAGAGDAALLDLLALCVRDTPNRGLSLGARAQSLIADDPGIDRGALAKALASNLGDVSRAFHRELGTTFRVYKQRTRVLSFLSEVDRGANMTFAALAAGFGSYSQCHRVFREVTGCSPREFISRGVRDEHETRFEPLRQPW